MKLNKLAARESKLKRLTTQSLLRTRYEACPTLWALTTGRSGSTTLSRALDSLPGVDAVHEAYPNLLREGRLAAEGLKLKRDACVRLLHLARGLLVEGAYLRQGMFADLSPFLTFLAEDIAAAFRQHRFVHLHRDPRAFVVSAMAKGWWTPNGINSHLYPEVPGKEPWQKAIRFWTLTHKEAIRLEGVLPVYRLAAEDLWTDVKAFERFLAWLGQSEEKSRQMRGVGASLVTGEGKNEAKGKRGWNDEWDGYLLNIAGGVMKELGYAHG